MRYLFLLFLLVSNCQDDPVVEKNTEESFLISELDFKQSEIRLTGIALQKALEWNEYQNFVTGLENYDHSKLATAQLQESVDDMMANPNEAFINLPITSRIKIVQTRLGIYRSFLDYTRKPKKDQLSKYNDIIIAWDELKTQMNVKFNEVDATKRKLLEQLNSEKRQDEQSRKRDSIRALEAEQEWDKKIETD
jgi:hypothetical protein